MSHDTTAFYTPARTRRALEDVAAERARQDTLYGHVNATLPNGTGPNVEWLGELGRGEPATGVEREFRFDYENFDAIGALTWMHLVREEVAEAFQESDPARLREELIQVAALCVAWAERL